MLAPAGAAEPPAGRKEEIMSTTRLNRLALLGLSVMAMFAAPAMAQPVLTIEGGCPGPMRAEIRVAQPHQGLWLLFSPRANPFRLPKFHFCSGVELGIGYRGLRVVGNTGADENGFAFFEGMAGPLACGGFLQTLGSPGGGCETSNVVQIP